MPTGYQFPIKMNSISRINKEISDSTKAIVSPIVDAMGAHLSSEMLSELWPQPI